MIDGAIDVADCRDCDEEDTPAAMTMNNFHQTTFSANFKWPALDSGATAHIFPLEYLSIMTSVRDVSVRVGTASPDSFLMVSSIGDLTLLSTEGQQLGVFF